MMEIRWSLKYLPEIPAPIITTAASVWSLFPTGTCGHGCDPPILLEVISFKGLCYNGVFNGRNGLDVETFEKGERTSGATG